GFVVLSQSQRYRPIPCHIRLRYGNQDEPLARVAEQPVGYLRHESAARETAERFDFHDRPECHVDRLNAGGVLRIVALLDPSVPGPEFAAVNTSIVGASSSGAIRPTQDQCWAQRKDD